MYPFPSLRYHNEPEGKNLKDKISSLVRIGAYFGSCKATYEVVCHRARSSLSIGDKTGIVAKQLVIPMAFGFSYALARYTITNIRKKHDAWNAFLAGAVNAPLIYTGLSHKLQSKPRITVLLPIIVGFLAVFIEAFYKETRFDEQVKRGSGIKGIFGPRVYSTYALE